MKMIETLKRKGESRKPENMKGRKKEIRFISRFRYFVFS